MRRLMLIGGGEIGKSNTKYETKEIDEEIVKMTEKENPNFLFIGLASSFSDSYYDIIKKIYKNLGCNCAYLKKKNIINNPDIVKNKIEMADIIYIGGGDTVKLISDITDFQIDILLKKALDSGKVLAGISAGAILLSKQGFSDSFILRGESNNHKFIKGLDYVDINICPHYKENSQKTKDLEGILKENSNISVIGLENCTALKIENNSHQIIKSNSTRKAYKVVYDKKLIEKELSSGKL